jgi:hypothetical protein
VAAKYLESWPARAAVLIGPWSVARAARLAKQSWLAEALAAAPPRLEARPLPLLVVAGATRNSHDDDHWASDTVAALGEWGVTARMGAAGAIEVGADVADTLAVRLQPGPYFRKGEADEMVDEARGGARVTADDVATAQCVLVHDDTSGLVSRGVPRDYVVDLADWWLAARA